MIVVLGNVNISGPTTVIARRANNTTVTLINTNQNSTENQRMSVFEPYPMRDTIQHFCEKHLDKIKSYMDMVSLRMPSPAKCTIEEKRQKKSAKLHFACQSRGQHCLYSKTYFTMRTRNPKIWIHLMFISLQVKFTINFLPQHWLIPYINDFGIPEGNGANFELFCATIGLI